MMMNFTNEMIITKLMYHKDKFYRQLSYIHYLMTSSFYFILLRSEDAKNFYLSKSGMK